MDCLFEPARSATNFPAPPCRIPALSVDLPLSEDEEDQRSEHLSPAAGGVATSSLHPTSVLAARSPSMQRASEGETKNSPRTPTGGFHGARQVPHPQSPMSLLHHPCSLAPIPSALHVPSPQSPPSYLFPRTNPVRPTCSLAPIPSALPVPLHQSPPPYLFPCTNPLRPTCSLAMLHLPPALAAHLME